MTEITEECGCKVQAPSSNSAQGYIAGHITYCPTHKAAPEMFAALEEILAHGLLDPRGRSTWLHHDTLEQLVAQARRRGHEQV